LRVDLLGGGRLGGVLPRSTRRGQRSSGPTGCGCSLGRLGETLGKGFAPGLLLRLRGEPASEVGLPAIVVGEAWRGRGRLLGFRRRPLARGTWRLTEEWAILVVVVFHLPPR